MLDPTPSQPQDSLIGKLIVASTVVDDAVLARSVSLVVHQDSDNLFAVLLNRPMTTPPGLAKLIDKGLLGTDVTANPDSQRDDSGAAKLTNRFGGPPEPEVVEQPDADAESQVPHEVLPTPTDAGNTVAEVSKSLGMIHFGGPMSGPVVAVHNSREHAEAEAGRGVYVAAQKDALETLIKQKPGSYRLIVGHLGWTVEQFQAECQAGYWHLIDATDENVFGVDQELWPSVIRRATTRSVARWMGISDATFDAEVN